MSDAPGFDGIRQRAGNVFLTDDVVKRLRPESAGKYRIVSAVCQRVEPWFVGVLSGV